MATLSHTLCRRGAGVKMRPSYDVAGILPATHDGGEPMCSHMVCPKYDGKRCELLGFEPAAVCIPAVRIMANIIAGVGHD